jgi:hypothetical protein
MQARRTLTPDQKGAKKFLDRYGEHLVCVRYRYDAEQRKRFKTVELIIEESLWQHPAKAIPDDEIVGFCVGLREGDLQRRVKTAGGKWNPGRRLWEIRYGQVLSLGLTDRIELRNVFDNGRPNVSIIRK